MKNGKKIECAGFAWVLQGGGGHFPGITVNSPTPTRRHIKSSRDVGELVVNPIQLRS